MTVTIKEMFEFQCGGADECGWCMKVEVNPAMFRFFNQIAVCEAAYRKI